MYDQVTLGLNVDPFILSALKEDITSEDVSTNSVMPNPTPGVVDLICKEDGIICGLQVFERVFTQAVYFLRGLRLLHRIQFWWMNPEV